MCENLEEKVVALLIEKQYTITTAESCTGGLLAGRILNVAGASEVFQEGYITYSNEAKMRILGVGPDTLRTYGAVSMQTAKEMAQKAALVASSSVALSVTGIAGPGGGTKNKPVGLVYLGCYVDGNVVGKECRFQGERSQNRAASVTESLKLLIEQLKQL